jgi:hypothetical protein
MGERQLAFDIDLILISFAPVIPSSYGTLINTNPERMSEITGWGGMNPVWYLI